MPFFWSDVILLIAAFFGGGAIILLIIILVSKAAIRGAVRVSETEKKAIMRELDLQRVQKELDAKRQELADLERRTTGKS